MKLLFIIPEYLPYSGGGIVTFYQNVLPKIVAQGHQVNVVVSSAFISKLPMYKLDGVTVDFLDSDVVSANCNKFNHYRATPELQRHLAAAWAAWEYVERGKGYDIVETTDWGLLFVPWIVEPESPATVIQLHGSIGQIELYDPQQGNELQGNLTRLLEVGLLSCADELQTNSQLNAQDWSLLTGREVTYIPPAWLSNSNLEMLNEESTHGLVVGRIQYWKGPIVLCEALRLLGNAAPIIDWIGRDMPYKESSTSMSSYLAQTYPDIWGVKIRPLGLQPPEVTARLQAAAKFIVVPSIWDVCNYTVIEGMGYAKVVVCSQGAGAASLIVNQKNGLTFPTNDPVALAKCLETVQSMDADARKRIGMLAQQTIQTNLEPSYVVKQRIQAYEQLLNWGKFPQRANPWLVNTVRPRSPLNQPLAFLDRLPLREISQYTLHRGLTKLTR